jgi:hypothetical protein
MQKGPPKQEGSSRSYLCDHLEDMEQIGVLVVGVEITLPPYIATKSTYITCILEDGSKFKISFL